MTITQRMYAAAFALALCLGVAAAAEPITAGFQGFDRRAKAGERLTVVFFGASLTWGANATDPAETSYRAVVRDLLAERYPKAPFRCHDAAIGGTDSGLAAFRLERDVLAWKPDLVFVDFTANDGIYGADLERLSAYESILRRLATAGIPVVQVAFPFRADIVTAKLPHMQRLAAHRDLAKAYGNGFGDAATAICRGVDAGRLKLDVLWGTDGTHPDNAGYREFGISAFAALVQAVETGLAPQVPATTVYPPIYQSLRRVRLADLPALPAGWRRAKPNLTAVFHDFQMSRWLDDLVVASNRVADSRGKISTPAQTAAPLRLRVQAASILLFGEASKASGRFRVRLDGTVLGSSGKDSEHLYDGNRWKDGNGHLVINLAHGLDPAVPHLLEIEPEFDPAIAQELRIESICVAGGQALVEVAP